MRSMTSYGRGEAQDNHFVVTVDLKSVNHRYKDFNMHLPPAVRPLEMRMKQALSARFQRGRFDVSLSLKVIHAPQQRLLIDYDLAGEIKAGLDKLKQDLKLEGDVTVDTISRFKDVFQLQEEDLAELLTPVVMEAMVLGMDAMDEMKLREGEAIRQDFENRIQKVRELRHTITEMKDSLVDDYREKLKIRINQILNDQNIDEYRLEQEVAFMAERSDISEELVRLKSHLDQFTETMLEDNSVGRKLDFILQEMNREVNTIASKSSNSSISSITINLKSEIEKIREQVQNIE